LKGDGIKQYLYNNSLVFKSFSVDYFILKNQAKLDLKHKPFKTLSA
jgi:hypothetical protein